MKFKTTTLYAAMFSAMVGIAGCSSDGGDNNTDTTTAANVTGKITGFGSVYVDGVEFETNGTTIYIDGVEATEADLRVGMLVNLTGSDNGTNGNAISISFDDEVEGVVTQTEAGGGLQVMGLSITADGTTHFDDLVDTNADGIVDISDLELGDKVEISGYPDGNGGVHATYIELDNTYDGSQEIEVKGVVASLDASTFMIGTMTVDFSGAAFSEGLTSAADLAEGQYVEVKSTAAPVAGVLAATEIELEDGGEYGVSGDEGEELEVEGMISEITDTTITVNGQTFDIPAGINVSGFAVGDLVDLDIEIVGGVATIHEIEDESHDDDHTGKIEVEAVVDATDTTVGSSSITLGGVTIAVDPAKVVMIDYSATANHIINLGDIVAGTDRVEVEAIPNEAGDGYIAISIEREASSDDTSVDTYVELEGPVTVTNDGVTTTYSLAGIVLDLASVNAFVINEGNNAVGEIQHGYKMSVKLEAGEITKVEVDIPEA